MSIFLELSYNFEIIVFEIFSKLQLHNCCFNYPETSWELCKILLQKYICNSSTLIEVKKILKLVSNTKKSFRIFHLKKKKKKLHQIINAFGRNYYADSLFLKFLIWLIVTLVPSFRLSYSYKNYYFWNYKLMFILINNEGLQYLITDRSIARTVLKSNT